LSIHKTDKLEISFLAMFRGIINALIGFEKPNFTEFSSDFPPRKRFFHFFETKHFSENVSYDIKRLHLGMLIRHRSKDRDAEDGTDSL